MKENWDKCINFVLKWEGGETYDTGGHTKFGISKNAHPDVDIENLIVEEAKEIYKKDYWNALGLDNEDYEWPFDLVLFDTAVNCGVGRAKEWSKDEYDFQLVFLKRI